MKEIKNFSVNKKASFEYYIIKEYEAGIVLKGSEVKSIRKSKVNIVGAYLKVIKGEIFIMGMKISSYFFSNEKLSEDRTRKILLRTEEINKIIGEVEKKGLTLIPLSIYNKNCYIKLKIALAKGKKIYDKREILSKKAQQRDEERDLKIKYKF